MADQAITALPKKTYSGSSKIAATDYLLGIDSAEGYQMLIQDLGEYIINKVTTSLAGSNQTLVAAIGALNSKIKYNNLGNIGTLTALQTALETLGDGISGISEASQTYSFYFYTTAAFAPFMSSQSVHIGEMTIAGTNRFNVTISNHADVGNYYHGTCLAGTWSWEKLSTRAEVDALNKKLSVEFISSNQTKTFTVTNPCWIFINEADDAMFFGMASGSRVNAIENSLVEVSIARPNNTSISITNNQAWGIRMWLLQF